MEQIPSLDGNPTSCSPPRATTAMLGSMATGIGVAAAIPIAAGLASYGAVKGIKALVKANKFNAVEVDDVLEIRRMGLHARHPPTSSGALQGTAGQPALGSSAQRYMRRHRFPRLRLRGSEAVGARMLAQGRSGDLFGDSGSRVCPTRKRGKTFST